MAIYYSNRTSPTPVGNVTFVPTFSNSGSITLDSASILTVGNYRKIDILFSSFDTDLSTEIYLPTGLFSKIYSLHSTRNILQESAGIFPTINWSMDTITIDRDDAIDTDSPLSISVIGHKFDGVPINAPPTIDAGFNSYVTTGVALSLDGTASDDGLPNPPGSLTTTWSKVSGPGNVIFGDSGLVDTTATFDATGTYILQLEGDDSLISTTDTIQVIATGVSGIEDGYQSLASTSVIYFKMNETTSDTTALNEVGENGTYVSISPDTANVSGLYDDTTTAITFDGSADYLSGPGYPIADGDSSISAYITTTDSNGYVLSSREGFSEGNLCMYIYGNGTMAPILGAWDGTGMGPVVNDGYTHHLVLMYNQSANTISGFVDNVFIGTQTPTGTPISGSPFLVGARSNGLPSISLPLNAVIDEVMCFNYILSIDNVDTLYNPVNLAPSVSAGSDFSAITGASTSLDATVSDDGRPDPPGSVTTTWSKISGPGNVTFGDSGVVDTTVSFDTSGSYVLQLEADDGELTTTDTLIATVSTGSSVDISYYQNIYDTNYLNNSGTFDTRVNSGVANTYYTFQFIMHATINMYKATGDTTYLVRALEWAEDMISNSVLKADGYYSWSGTDTTLTAFATGSHLDEMQGSTEMAHIAMIIHEDPTLNATYGSRATTIYEWVRDNIIEKWQIDRTRDGWARAITDLTPYPDEIWNDKVSLTVSTMCRLVRSKNIIGGSADSVSDHTSGVNYHDFLSLMANRFSNRLEQANTAVGCDTDGGSSSDETLVYDCERNDWKITDHAPDTSHANRDPVMCIDLIGAGYDTATGIQMSHITGLSNLLSEVIYDGSTSTDPKFYNFIDGNNDTWDSGGPAETGPYGLGVVYFGWVLLSQYDQTVFDIMNNTLHGVQSGLTNLSIASMNNEHGSGALAGHLAYCATVLQG